MLLQHLMFLIMEVRDLGHVTHQQPWVALAFGFLVGSGGGCQPKAAAVPIPLQTLVVDMDEGGASDRALDFGPVWSCSGAGGLWQTVAAGSTSTV